MLQWRGSEPFKLYFNTFAAAEYAAFSVNWASAQVVDKAYNDNLTEDQCKSLWIKEMKYMWGINQGTSTRDMSKGAKGVLVTNAESTF